MKGQLLLRSAQRHHALGAPSSYRRITTFNDTSASLRVGLVSGMAHLSFSPSRTRSKLRPVDLNAAGYATKSSQHKHRWQGRGKRNGSVAVGHRDGPLPGKKTPSTSWDNSRENILSRPGFPKETDFLPEQNYAYFTRSPREALSPALGSIAECHDNFVKIPKGVEHTVRVVWNDASREPLLATGQGKTGHQALNAAWLHLALQLHLANQLAPLVPAKLKQDEAKKYAEETRAMEDVYNYCARYDQMPNIERSAGSRAGQGSKKAFRTRIVFPELNIDVAAMATSVRVSDMMAAARFKEAIENYHASQGTESLVVKAGTALNLDTVDDFFKFCRTQDPAARNYKYEEETLANQVWEGRLMDREEQIGPTVRSGQKSMLAAATKLGAALEIVQRTPQIKDDFLAALRLGNGKILTPVPTMDLPLDDSAVLVMRDTLAKARQHGLGDHFEPLHAEELDDPEMAFTQAPTLPDTLKRRTSYLKRARRDYETSSALAGMREIRRSLPMNAYAREVLEIIEQNQYSIIIGETGSGKTTQVPQILLDHFADSEQGANCNVVCTQPRRIAATSVAKRVAAERGEPLKSAVGYHVRGDYARAEQPGSINFCTTGVLLVQLQSNPDALMDKLSHIVIDEVHERDKIIDYLMIILRQIISQRLKDGKPSPKVVLMSATLDPSLFSPYFKNAQEGKEPTDAPVLRVPGRTFPVSEKYLEDLYNEMKAKHGNGLDVCIMQDKTSAEYLQYERAFSRDNAPQGGEESVFVTEGAAQNRIVDWKRTVNEGQAENTEYQDKLIPVQLIAATISHICQTTTDGAILVFLPGWDEIASVERLLTTTDVLGVRFNDPNKFKLYTLHSSIGDSQTHVFDKVAPGQRKIILSTNIAETSVTIPDVQYVVDTGKVRELTYDQTRRMTTLACQWVSKSNAKQRAGRAGRVHDGNYYALYTKSRYDSFRAVGLPELLRTDLQETCLSITSQKWPTPPREFLADAIEPPNPDDINVAMKSLIEIDALTPHELLTPLGRLLSGLPIHPELGKMVIFGIIFRCLDPMIILGSASSCRALFVQGIGENKKLINEKIAHFAAGTQSDHIAVLNAFRELRAIRRSQGLGVARDFAFSNGIHWGAYNAIEANAQLIEAALMQARLIPTITAADRVSYQWGDGSLNIHSRKSHVIKALATAGLYPRIAFKADPNVFFWRTQSEAEVRTHPSSVNYVQTKQRVPHEQRRGSRESMLAIFDALARSADGASLFIRNCTYVSPLAVALFCGRLRSRDSAYSPAGGRDNNASHRASSSVSNIVTVDEWLPFYLQSDDRLTVRTLLELRKALERMLVGAYADLSKRQTLTEHPVRAVLADGIVNILSLDMNRYGTMQSQAKLSDRDSGEIFRRMRDSLAPSESANAAGRIDGIDPMKKKLANDGVSIGMLEWAAKWEARGRARQQKEAMERGG